MNINGLPCEELLKLINCFFLPALLKESGSWIVYGARSRNISPDLCLSQYISRRCDTQSAIAEHFVIDSR
jgi:hypothetical protein